MRPPSPPMKLTCLQVTRRLSKLLGSQDDSDQTGTQPTNELVKTLYQHTALGGGLTPGSPKQPKRQSPTPKTDKHKRVPFLLYIYMSYYNRVNTILILILFTDLLK